MKNEKIKFAKEALLILLALILIILIMNSFYTKQVLTKKNFYKKEISYQEFLKDNPSKEVDYIFFGDSHTFHGINPEYIPNSFNWGSGTQNYIKEYYLLNRLINQDNLKIKTIVIQTDLHSFSSWLTKEPFIFNELELYSQFTSLEDVKKIRKKSLISLFIESKIPVIGKGKEFGIFFSKQPLSEVKLGWIKGDSNFSNHNETERKKIAERDYKTRFENQERISDLSLEYYQKLLELANENNINIVLIKFPMSKEFDEMTFEKNIEKENYYPQIFSKTNSIVGNNYSVLDYYSLFENNLEYFGDSTHLNPAGAEALSKQINRDLEKFDWNAQNTTSDNPIKLKISKKEPNPLISYLIIFFVFELILIILIL